MAPEVKPAKNSKLPKLPENCFEPVGKGGWPPISTWIMLGLKAARDMGINKLSAFGDSELIVHQVRNIYQTKQQRL
jgi:hypothetical protein